MMFVVDAELHLLVQGWSLLHETLFWTVPRVLAHRQRRERELDELGCKEDSWDDDSEPEVSIHEMSRVAISCSISYCSP